jgi:PilZ domain
MKQLESAFMERWEEFAGGMPRAPRFPLEFPLRYRLAEEVPWREGRGTNISRSGLLFQVAEPLVLQTPVEVTFVIPVPTIGQPAATVVCKGHVVRQGTAGESPSTVTVAATIETYRLQRESHG